MKNDLMREIEEVMNEVINENNIEEVISIDSETAERDPDLVKKLQDKIGDEDMININENYIRNLINENENPSITKDKLLKSLNL